MALTKIPGELFSVGDLDISDVGIISLDAIQGDADSNTSITFSGSDVITIATGGSGRLTIGDGALSPVTDNQIDLGTSSLEFKDAFFDGTVTSDAFAGPLTGDVTGNVSGTAATVTGGTQASITTLANATTVGALDAGSITSGFGTIDTGSSAITTTGLITGGSLDIDDVLINGTTIGHTDDTDLITLADGVVTVAGEISVTTLDIGGTNVASTAAELNIMDGDTSASSTTLADADRVVVNDNGTMKQVALTDFETYFESAIDTIANLEVSTELQTPLIAYTDGDDAITIADGGGITAAAGITSTAAANTFGATSFNDAAITNVGDIALDSISSDAGTGTAITFGAGVVGNTVAEAASGNYTPDMSRYTNFILTVNNSNNCTLVDPTDETAGQSGIFVFVQDGTGGGTLSHAENMYFTAGGAAITLSTAANAIDVVPYFVQADGKIHLGKVQLAFADA